MTMTAFCSDSNLNGELFRRAQAVIPGGVNSPVRAFNAVGGIPPFIARASGPYLWDAQGKRYIDYIGSWGPMILGHGHPAVLEAVHRAVDTGLSFGAPTEREVELAELVKGLLPSIEMLRLVNSGTEAAMSALRLARGATGRNRIIKFEGCYHGHADALLVKAGSGLANLRQSTSAGVPDEVIQHTIVLEYNNCQQLEDAFADFGDQLAGLIIEPICGNMNFIRAQPAFIRMCRDLCTRHGVVLIFDEVMTGFRVGLRGAQGLLDIVPDLTVLGKVIGGGMPLAAFGGKRSIMEQLAPIGSVYQAGTLSGNPVATACGIATLHELVKPNFYECLSAKTKRFAQSLQDVASRHGLPFRTDSEGGMFGFFLLPHLPLNYREVLQSDSSSFSLLFHELLEQGIYVAPALYEAGFVSSAHSESDIEESLVIAERAFMVLQRKSRLALDSRVLHTSRV